MLFSQLCIHGYISLRDCVKARLRSVDCLIDVWKKWMCIHKTMVNLSMCAKRILAVALHVFDMFNEFNTDKKCNILISNSFFKKKKQSLCYSTEYKKVQKTLKPHNCPFLKNKRIWCGQLHWCRCPLESMSGCLPERPQFVNTVFKRVLKFPSSLYMSVMKELWILYIHVNTFLFEADFNFLWTNGILLNVGELSL